MSDDAPASKSFEELMSELEEIVTKMASPEIGIEEAADLHEQASRLHDSASSRLVAIERRIAALGGQVPSE